MDETGLALGVTNNVRVIGSTATKTSFKRSPEDREWVSIIETISASGTLLPPVVIFKGKSIQSTWYRPEYIPSWLYTVSENGWTSNKIGLEWLRQVFLPSTSPPTGEWRLLLIDGHGSHATVDFMWECWINKIYIYYLLPHSSHVLQPLDLTCFSPLKTRYRSQIAELAHLDDTAPVKKERFLRYYEKARNTGLTVSNIRSGWATAGIEPWNPDRVLNQARISTVATQAPKTPTKDRGSTTIGHKRMRSDQYLRTPQNRADLDAWIQTIGEQDTLPRTVHTLLFKTTKVIDRFT